MLARTGAVPSCIACLVSPRACRESELGRLKFTGHHERVVAESRLQT